MCHEMLAIPPPLVQTLPVMTSLSWAAHAHQCAACLQVLHLAGEQAQHGLPEFVSLYWQSHALLAWHPALCEPDLLLLLQPVAVLTLILHLSLVLLCASVL